MPLALLSDLKARLNISDAGKDALLTNLLSGVSALLDQHCQRVFLYTDADITEQFDGDVWDLRLKRWPVTSIVSVKESSSYDWDNVDALTANTDFLLIDERGVIRRLPTGMRWLEGSRVVQVVYRGGYVDPALDPVEGVDYVPTHVQEACLLQTVDLWGRKSEPGYKIVAGMQAGLSTGCAPAIELLPMVKQLLANERR